MSPRLPAYQGQKNLSGPLNAYLKSLPEIEVVSHFSGDKGHLSTIRLLFTLLRLYLVRLPLIVTRARTDELVIIDMIFSFNILSSKHTRSHFILIGHDSYALRVTREFRASKGARKYRLLFSYLLWRLIERLSRLLCERRYYVSEVDRQAVGDISSADILRIPVTHKFELPAQSVRSQTRLVLMANVVHEEQHRIYVDVANNLIRRLQPSQELVIWGSAAARVYAALSSTSDQVSAVEYVPDYFKFLSESDIYIYPRLFGSGFHTKVAEAACAGGLVHCPAWIADPMIDAGFDTVYGYTNLNDMFVTLDRQLASSFQKIIPTDTKVSTKIAAFDTLSEYLRSQN